MKGKYIGMIAGATFIGASLYNSNGPTKEECLTYRGHTTMYETSVAIFDDKPFSNFSERAHSPELAAEDTRPENAKLLETGKKYSVKVQEPRLFGLTKLLSTSSCD